MYPSKICCLTFSSRSVVMLSSAASYCRPYKTGVDGLGASCRLPPVEVNPKSEARSSYHLGNSKNKGRDRYVHATGEIGFVASSTTCKRGTVVERRFIAG